MGGDERKKQKQLARKRAKQRAARSAGQPTQGKKASLLRDVRRAASSPVHACLVTGSRFETGMRNLFVARELPGGSLGLAGFLLDTYCLGVKDAWFSVLHRAEFLAKTDALRAAEPLAPIDPCCARKLVDGSVAYARGLGFMPSPEYALASRLLADADPTACEEEFEFGHEGKPYYVSGPYDTPQQVKYILRTLERKLGPEGFHYSVVADAASLVT